METNPASTQYFGRWAAGLSPGEAGRSAREELAGTFWYSVYACLRAGGAPPEIGAQRTESALTRFVEEPAAGAPLLRERLLTLAREAAENAPVPALLAIDREWAAARFATEAPRSAEETFARRWTLGLIENTLATLDAEYADRAPAFTAMQPFLGYSGGAEGDGGSYAELAAQLSSTEGGARKAVFDLRTRYRDLLRAAVAETVARKDQIDSELSALLIELPPPAASVAPRSVLRRVNPEELLARAMHTARVSSAGAHGWMPPSVEEVAQLLPQYDIVALLGHGGMGAVYQGRQRELDRLVAIKLLPLEISAERDFADRFRREARAMARLEHPHIIAVHDFGQTSEGHLFFVMDFVNGATLHAKIHREKLPPAEALGILAQVCDALAYAHEEGVVHRDIKPANVMVDQRGRVKVADFGLARLTGGAAPESGLTQIGTVMGTLDYMAPEQRRGMDVDHRADIFSTGVMLYEALTGEVPHGLFKAASQKAAAVDPRIDQVIGRALRPEPEERYQTSGEMKAAIETIRNDPPPAGAASPLGAGKAGAPGAAGAGGKLSPSPATKKPNPALFYGGIAAAVLVLLGVIFAVRAKKGSTRAPRVVSGAPAGNASTTPGAAANPATRAAAVSPLTGSKTTPDAITFSARAPKTAREARALLIATPATDAAARSDAPGQSTAPEGKAPSSTGNPATTPREWLISKTANVPPPADALEFQGSRYKYFAGVFSWVEAKQRAEAMGGHLATITTPEEFDWLAKQLPGQPEEASIGGFVAKGTDDWRWCTGELVQELWWSVGNPQWRDTLALKTGVKSAAVFAFRDHPSRKGISLVSEHALTAKTKGFLVEWDRFSAADATANDPARWKPLLTSPDKVVHEKMKWTPRGIEIAKQASMSLTEVRGEDFALRATLSLVREARYQQIRLAGHTVELEADKERPSILIRRATSGGNRILARLNFTPQNPEAGVRLLVRKLGSLLLIFADDALLGSHDLRTTAAGTPLIFAEENGRFEDLGWLPLDALPSTSASLPSPSTSPAATPPPVAPKPLTDMEKWLAQVEGPPQESFAREVVKPFEVAVAELKKGYVAALDGRIAAASAAGKLDDALGWRTERQRFAEGGAGMPVDDRDLAALASKAVAIALPPLRAQYRTHLAKLEADRLTKARAAFARFDAILTPTITQLTQRGRLDDALLLKTKLDTVRTAWLEASPPASAGGTPARPTGGTPALQTGATPKPASDASSIPAGPRPALKKYPKGDDRKAAEWVLSLGGDVEILPAGRLLTKVTKVEDLPKSRFSLIEVNLQFRDGSPKPLENLEPLAGLQELAGIVIKNMLVEDEYLAALTSLPKLAGLSIERARLTDEAVGYALAMPALKSFAIQSNLRFSGVRLAELAGTQVTDISLIGCRLAPEAFPALARLKALRRLSLQQTKITDEEVAALQPLTELRTFQLSPSNVTLAGLKEGPPLRNLDSLGWNFTPGRASEELKEVAQLCPNLRRYELELDGTALTYAEADIAALAAFRGLTEQTASGKRFTDDAARGLLAVKTLKKLSFSRSTVTDAALSALAEHRNIEDLNCDSPEITDTGLMKLTAMKQLKKLKLPGAKQLTPAGLAAFQKARPDVTLVR